MAYRSLIMSTLSIHLQSTYDLNHIILDIHGRLIGPTSTDHVLMSSNSISSAL